MIIDRPGLYLRVDPLRITSAAVIGNELVAVDFAMSSDEAASLGTQLLALSALERQEKLQQAKSEKDVEFLRSMKVSPE